jgi:hypothetical protein
MRETVVRAALLAALAAATVGVACQSRAYNRDAHVALFNRSLIYLNQSGQSEAYDFYTGKNPDSIDVRVLADSEDEIMWVDAHSTTEPDEDAANYLIDKSFAYCWNDKLRRLEDAEDIEACKDCIRAVVDQYPSIALPRAGQETTYYPSRDTDRSRYNFCWEVPLSFIIGLVDSVCDRLGEEYGVLAENSLRSEVQVHTSKFKSMEYLNYAIRSWNDSDCETALRWLIRIVNYDPHHSLTPFKSFDYLTEDWVSVDMDGDLDVDYQDSEAWNRQQLNYGIFYLFFCDLADGRIPSVSPGSIVLDSVDILDWHSLAMNERATYSAGLWHMVDELMDYFNGNATDAIDELLPEAVISTAELLTCFHERVVTNSHREFALICIEGIPKNILAPFEYTLDYGDHAHMRVDSLRGEHFRYYGIPASFGIRAKDCVACDTTVGYRFDYMVVCDGSTTIQSRERDLVVERATTIHLIYTPFWENGDEVQRPDEEGGNEQSSLFDLPHPAGPVLSEPVPNPASGETAIRYSLAAESHVSLDLYNTAGQKVMTVIDLRQEPGQKLVTLSTEKLKPGIYFSRFRAGGYTSVRKLVVVR